ncbi:MAG: hypothetical protein WBA51_02760 [Erythrobacter sp.]
MLIPLALVGGAFGAFGVSAQSSKDWAACIAEQAPVSGKNWIELGGPRSKLGEDERKRASNLGFRLKAICASTVAPESEFEAVEFDSKSVFKALRKIDKKSPISLDAEEAAFDTAGLCSMHFLAKDLDKIGDDAEQVDRDLLAGAGMAFTSFELINPELPNPSLVSAKQSNGAPMKVFSQCKIINSDGTLSDA